MSGIHPYRTGRLVQRKCVDARGLGRRPETASKMTRVGVAGSQRCTGSRHRHRGRRDGTAGEATARLHSVTSDRGVEGCSCTGSAPSRWDGVTVPTNSRPDWLKGESRGHTPLQPSLVVGKDHCRATSRAQPEDPLPCQPVHHHGTRLALSSTFLAGGALGWPTGKHRCN